MEGPEAKSISWSISSPKDDSSITPVLTSLDCYRALVDFFHDKSSFNLQVATESSSHVSGLDSLFAQPWVYAGGGLGNIDECPLQTCLAGAATRDSLTFASVCVVPECTAVDLSAADFPGRLKAASFEVDRKANQDIVQEYVTLNERIAEVNKFLGTGWVCGEYKAEWQYFPSVLYLAVLGACCLFSIVGTFCDRRPLPSLQKEKERECASESAGGETIREYPGSNHAERCTQTTNGLSTLRSCNKTSFWAAWNMSENAKRLTSHRSNTSFLDGLKVGSILWVILGHIMAIQSSSGPGYLNPSDFLPPTGITTTLVGQLFFSSRFAVDTFLCISGFLVVHVLRERLTPSVKSIFQILAFRILRILPLYLACLFFWILIAPHLGSGPFWYQWESLIQPCRQYWWTNVLFVNNFLPWGAPTTSSCFYHSWYLAVDVQLFFLFAPWLILLFRKSASIARRVTFAFWLVSVFITAILAYKNQWSINTFDGISVALFDIEGYAKPHVRAQSYLFGMLVAMSPQTRRRSTSQDIFYIVAAISMLALLSLITATGAYARRPCTFEESPLTADCGSLWPFYATFLYTAFSRGLWSICIGAIMYLCFHRRGHFVGKVLSLRIFTSLAHLSFGAYLVHPIIIFLWQLGEREKTTFRTFTLLMDFVAISVFSFSVSAIAALTVEFPLNNFLRRYTAKQERDFPVDKELIPLTQSSSVVYGSNRRNNGERPS